MTKSEKEKYELIEKFIEKSLSKEEKEVFEHSMKSDPGFANEVKAHEEVHELLLDQGILNVKKKLQQIHKAETGRDSTYNKLYIAVAALMMTGGIIYYIYQSSKTPVLSTATIEVKNNQTQPVVTENSSEEIVQDNSIPTNSKTIEHKSKPSVTSNDNTLTPSLPTTDNKDADANQTQNINSKNNNTDNTDATNNSTAGDTKPTNSDAKAADCSSIRITGNADPAASCTDKNDGSITIQLNSIKGGKQPYKFSIDEDSDFFTSSQFNQLGPDKYKIYVLDANGCKSLLNEVIVGSKDCQLKENLFYPDMGGEWTIPLKTNANGKLTIMNKAGIVVYTIPITNGYPATWNGTDSNGQMLPGGNYSYIIYYNDQSISNGSVSIIR